MELINGMKERTEQLIQSGYQPNVGEYFRRGWKIFEKNAGGFIAYVLLFILISAVSAFIPFAPLLISGPLLAGFFIVSHRISKGEAHEFNTFFRGFDFFVPLLLYTLISGIFIALGFIALIVPGIYLAVSYSFAPMFIVFGKMEFWDAMEYSRKLITRNWWSLFGLMLLLFLLNIAGTLLLFVGLLFTIPLSYCILYAAFEDIVKPE
jgi:uncharacterized membrane protein